MLAEEKDEKMIEFAMGGVCNCCLDKENKTYFIENEGIPLTVKCLTRYMYMHVYVKMSLTQELSSSSFLQCKPGDCPLSHHDTDVSGDP